MSTIGENSTNRFCPADLDTLKELIVKRYDKLSHRLQQVADYVDGAANARCRRDNGNHCRTGGCTAVDTLLT
nr:hypothetical protein [Photobacterium alginatilyticum]